MSSIGNYNTFPDEKHRRRGIRAPANEIDTLYDIALHVQGLEQIVAPIRFIYKDIEIRILEVSKVDVLGKTWYIVICQFLYGEKMSKPFPIYAESVDDFIDKIRQEIIRVRMMRFLIRDTFDFLFF